MSPATLMLRRMCRARGAKPSIGARIAEKKRHMADIAAVSPVNEVPDCIYKQWRS